MSLIFIQFYIWNLLQIKLDDQTNMLFELSLKNKWELYITLLSQNLYNSKFRNLNYRSSHMTK